MARVDGGSDGFALHADAVYRNALDYDTPEGRQANSFIDTRSGASELVEQPFAFGAAFMLSDDNACLPGVGDCLLAVGDQAVAELFVGVLHIGDGHDGYGRQQRGTDGFVEGVTVCR